MSFGEIIGLFVLWSIFGLFGLVPMITHCGPHGAIAQAWGLEFVNPIFVYKHNRVNWFGALIVATGYGLVCPMATIGYWFYKLCTVGRK